MKTILLDSNYWDGVIDRLNCGILEKNVALYYKNEHIRLIEKWAKGLQGKKILKTDLFEEAALNGDFLFWFLNKGAKVFGMDISSKIAARALSHSPGHCSQVVEPVASDINHCAFRDDSFDIIISNSTIDNLKDKDVAGALKELRRILKPDGVLILTLDNALNPLYRLGYLIEKILKTNKYYQGRCYTRKEAEGIVRDSGFLVQDSEAIVHIPTPFNKIALLLNKGGSFDALVRNCIRLFSRMGAKRSKFMTGWFIAMKLVKTKD